MYLSSEKEVMRQGHVTQATGMPFSDIKIDLYMTLLFFNSGHSNPCTKLKNAFIYLLIWPSRF